jgi:hypothetical protein
MDLISLGLGFGSSILGGIGGQSQADAQNEMVDRISMSMILEAWQLR